jgi:hypothetical protein
MPASRTRVVASRPVEDDGGMPLAGGAAVNRI